MDFSTAAGASSRTVVLIGRTGVGKSSCANVLASCGQDNLFKESDGSVSEKAVRAETVSVNWSCKQYSVKIVDTIGIGDTSLSSDEVLEHLAATCSACCDGINAVYFVTSGLITKEEMSAWDAMWQVLFGADVLDYTAIIRTKFVNFRDPTRLLEDMSDLKKGKMLPHIKTRLYVDNPPLNCPESKERRLYSREVLLSHLISQCEKVFKPPVMSEVKKMSNNASMLNRAISKIELWEAQLQLASQLEQQRIKQELRRFAKEKETAAKAIAQEMQAIINKKTKEDSVMEQDMASVGRGAKATVETECSVM